LFVNVPASATLLPVATSVTSSTGSGFVAFVVAFGVGVAEESLPVAGFASAFVAALPAAVGVEFNADGVVLDAHEASSAIEKIAAEIALNFSVFMGSLSSWTILAHAQDPRVVSSLSIHLPTSRAVTMRLCSRQHSPEAHLFSCSVSPKTEGIRSPDV
jgi:hypothetical protein